MLTTCRNICVNGFTVTIITLKSLPKRRSTGSCMLVSIIYGWPSHTEDQKKYLTEVHVDHCLDLLRQALMCRADTSLMTFHWEDGEREPMLKLESPEHVCVDWDDLMEKVGDRRVSDADMDRLTNPSLSM